MKCEVRVKLLARVHVGEGLMLLVTVIKRLCPIHPENNDVILFHSADVPQTWNFILIFPPMTGFQYNDLHIDVASLKTCCKKSYL